MRTFDFTEDDNTGIDPMQQRLNNGVDSAFANLDSQNDNLIGGEGLQPSKINVSYSETAPNNNGYPIFEAIHKSNLPYIDENTGIPQIKSNTQKVVELLGLTKPPLDAARAERLKKQAAINSIGDALKAAFSGIIGGPKGHVQNTQNEYVYKALKDYQNLIDKDTELQYRTKLAQANAEIGGIGDELRQRLANQRYNAELRAGEEGDKRKYAISASLAAQKAKDKADELAAQHGYNMERDKGKSAADMDKLAKQGKDRFALERYRQGQENYRARLKSEGKGGSGKSIAEEMKGLNAVPAVYMKNGNWVQGAIPADRVPYLVERIMNDLTNYSYTDNNGQTRYAKRANPIVEKAIKSPDVIDNEFVNAILQTPEGRKALIEEYEYLSSGKLNTRNQIAEDPDEQYLTE